MMSLLEILRADAARRGEYEAGAVDPRGSRSAKA